MITIIFKDYFLNNNLKIYLLQNVLEKLIVCSK